jgi:hypothetical protein
MFGDNQMSGRSPDSPIGSVKPDGIKRAFSKKTSGMDVAGQRSEQSSAKSKPEKRKKNDVTPVGKKKAPEASKAAVATFVGDDEEEKVDWKAMFL